MVLKSLGHVWKKIGVPDFPLVFNQKKIKKVIKKHRISEEELLDLPVDICNPYMIFRSKTDYRSFVAVLKNTSSPLIAVVLPLDDEDEARNIIKSFYWKDKDFIERETKEKRLIYKKSEETNDDALIAESPIASDRNIVKKYYLYLFNDV